MTAPESLPGGAPGALPSRFARSPIECWAKSPLITGTVRLPLELFYSVDDPWEITLFVGRERIAWTVARALLDAGRHHRVGDGDVVVMPHLDQWVEIVLAPPNHNPVRLSVTRADLDAAIAFTEELVPPGAERQFYDLDTELTIGLRPRSGGAR